ncbi:MAG: hypothetical protein ACM3KR_06545 [Deltaproteobacteria bacterium]
MEETGVQNTQGFSGGERPKKRMPVAIVILFILVLLCAGALSVINFFPEVIPAKMIYMLAEKQNIMQIQKQVEDYMNDGFVKDALKVYDTPFSNSSELTFKFKPETLQSPEAAQLKVINDILSSSKLTINQSSDYKNDKNKAEYILNIKGNDLIKAEMFMDKKKLGIKVPAFYDKYITIDGNNMEPLFKKFGQDVQMKKLVTPSEMFNAVKFDRKEVYNLIDDYSKYIIKQLKDKNFKFTKGVKLSTSEGDITCNQIALTLTAAEFKEIGIKVLEKMQNDDRLLNLTAGNVINVIKLYEDAGYFGTAGVPSEFKDINSVKQKIKEAIDSAKKDTTVENDKTETVMTLLIDRKFNILERKFELVDKGSDSKATGVNSIRFGSFSQPKSKGKETIFEIKDPSMKSRFTVDAVQAPSAKGQPVKTAVNIESVSSYTGTEEKPFVCKIDITDDSIKDKSKKINAKFEATMLSYGAAKSVISGTLTTDSVRDSGAGTINNKVSFDVTGKTPGMSGQGNELGIILGLDSKMKLGEAVKMPSVDASNSLEINTATDEQLQQVVMQIQTAAQNFYLQNLKLFAPSGM